MTFLIAKLSFPLLGDRKELWKGWLLKWTLLPVTNKLSHPRGSTRRDTISAGLSCLVKVHMGPRRLARDSTRLP